MKNYRVAQGMPSNNVYYTMQDSKGFLWFGTDMGMAQYNGYEFKNYSVDDGLPDNEIFQIIEDSEGRLWMSTLNGNIAYFHQGEVHKIKEGAQSDSISANMIRSICDLENGQVAVARVGSKVTIVNEKQELQSPAYGTPHFIWTQYGELYGVSDLKVQNLRTGKNELVLPFIQNYPIRGCHKNNRTVLAEGTSVCILDGLEIGHSFHLPEEHREVIGLYIHEQTVWLGTRNGVVAVALETGKVLATYLEGYQVTGTVCDNEGNYWFSTLYSGAFQWPGSAIKKMVVDPQNPNRRINAIEFDENGTLWLGHDQNGYSVLPKNGEARTYTFTGKAIDNVTGFKFYKQETFVISKARSFSHQNPEIRFDVFINDLEFMEKEAYVLSASVSRLQIDSLFSLHGRPREQAKQLSRMRTDNTLLNSRGISICRISETELYIGTMNGLYHVKNGEEPERALADLINSTVTQICTLGEQGVCVATTANGLVILHENGSTSIRAGKGVPSNNCQALHVSSDQDVWACFENKLYLMKQGLSGWYAENYSNKLGLVDQKIRSITTQGSQVYLGTDYGLLHFNKHQNSEKRDLPFYLDSVLVNGVKVDVRKDVFLPSRHNSLDAYFTGISYISNGEIGYSYAIEGLDSVVNKTRSRHVSFRSVPYGDYTLRIKATTDDGGKAELAPIRFTVITPLHAKTWFWPLVVLAVLGLISSITIYRIKSIKRRHSLERKRLETEKEKNLIEKQLAELQEKALRMQMNPHFVFNALNTIKGFYAEERSTEADHYIVRFSKLLRVILETQGKEISLEQEIKSLTLYLELLQIRYNYQFDFSFQVGANVDIEEIEMPSMMLQPFVENAVIHGLAPKDGKGFVQIGFLLEQGKLKVSIEDNGVGRSYFENSINEGHESAATGITEERLRLFNQLNAASASLSIVDLMTNGKPSGTIVELSMDIQNEWE